MEALTATLILKAKRQKPVLNRHPWVFSGAIARIEGEPESGDLVLVAAADKTPLAIATYSPHSQIRARILSWEVDQPIDGSFWRQRIEQAVAARERLQLQPETNAWRLIFGEADLLPGLVVDQYDHWLVMQCLTAGIDRRKELLAEILASVCDARGVVERSDAKVRKKEGLPRVKGVLWGEAPPEQLQIKENGLTFAVELLFGHKTGFYLDQRDNRALVTQPKNVADKDVLNCFAYTGAFAAYAGRNGARQILNVDSSYEALELAEQNVTINCGERPLDTYLAGDAFDVLRHLRDEGRQFDMVILDPPKFANSQRDIDRACRGYKDLNWLGMRLLRPGGLLATFSCSGLISTDLFQKVLFGAAVDAGRDMQIIHPLHQGADHPILLTFPESAYLKGFLLRNLS